MKTTISSSSKSSNSKINDVLKKPTIKDHNNTNLCNFCHDYIVSNTENLHCKNTKNSIDLSGYKGKVSFEGCGHEYHITCFINRYNITKETRCYCITKTKANISLTNSEDINNAKDVMTLQNVEKTSIFSAETLQLLKRNIENIQRDKLIVSTTIGTNAIDNLATKIDAITPSNQHPDWSKIPSRIDIHTHIKSIRTLDDIEKLKKHHLINFNVLLRKGVTILDLVQSFGEKLQKGFIDALVYLEIDDKDKLLRLGFSLTFLREEMHYIFDPDKMCTIYKIDYTFINSIKTSPYDLCNMKYRADLLKDMGFNVETLVEFGITGDHIEHMGLDVLEWKTSLGLNEKNYNMLNITPKNIQNMNWDPATVKNAFKLQSSDTIDESPEFIISKFPTANDLVNSIISKDDSIEYNMKSLTLDSKSSSSKKKKR